MKVLLIKDVYKLGHAGDVKKVADGFGRNFLLPQGLAILATAGAIKQVDHIRTKANASRSALNNEMSGISEKIANVVLSFSSKAGETGKLYGSITNQMIAEELTKKLGTEINRRQVDLQPIRTLGEHKAVVRLTVDMTPEVKVIVLREGERVTAAPKVETPTKVETPVNVEEAAEAPAAEPVSA
jgi:large subunit ribosomal protein L9